MRIVELDVLRDALVGVPGQSGLSVEARKRLSIAVEQVANPSVIFMDEPTSGALRTETPSQSPVAPLLRVVAPGFACLQHASDAFPK